MATIHGAFANCCGLDYASGFATVESDPRLIEKANKFLIDYSTVPSPMRYRFGPTGTEFAQNCVIVLNGGQVEAHKDALEKGGWICVHKFVNHNYSDVLYLYFHDTQPEKSPGNPKFDTEKYEEYTNKQSIKRNYVRTKKKKKVDQK